MVHTLYRRVLSHSYFGVTLLFVGVTAGALLKKANFEIIDKF